MSELDVKGIILPEISRSANGSYVLENGQECIDSDTGDLYIGDGVTTFENLTAIGGKDFTSEIEKINSVAIGKDAEVIDERSVAIGVDCSADSTTSDDPLNIDIIEQKNFTYIDGPYDGITFVLTDLLSAMTDFIYYSDKGLEFNDDGPHLYSVKTFHKIKTITFVMDEDYDYVEGITDNTLGKDLDCELNGNRLTINNFSSSINQGDQLDFKCSWSKDKYVGYINKIEIELEEGEEITPHTSVSIGYNNKATSNSILIGNGLNGEEENIIIGANSNISGKYNVSVGTNTYIDGDFAVALGDYATASSAYTTALGYNATASGGNAVALGQGATASGGNAVALGDYATASGNYSTALGDYATASSAYTTALGYNATASGSSATALGQGATASGTCATALGYSATASGGYTTALGDYATASSAYTTALGYNATASSAYTTALGYNATASGSSATALGYSATASGTYAIKIGYSGSSSYYASGDYSIAIGYHSGATYNYSTALGYNATTDGTYRIQLGGADNSYVYYYGTLSSRSDERDKTDITPFDDKTSLDFITSLDTFTYRRNPRERYEEKTTDENGEETYTDPNHYLYGLGAYDHEAHERGDKKGQRLRSGISAQNIQEKMKEYYGEDYDLNLVNDNLYDRRKDGEEIPEGIESQLNVSYISFIPLLISAIKEQEKEIKELKDIIETLQK